MTDIDWMAVTWVCNGTPLKLTRDEKLMVIRRLADKMATSPSKYDDGLPIPEVARRLQITTRTVERLKSELSHADPMVCPVCREHVWVVAGTVESHPDALFNQCPMSGCPTRRGLAAIRPDLYQWLDEGILA